MCYHILKRFLSLIPVLLVISLVTFSLMHLIPGDPAEAILGFETVDPMKLETIRRSLGLDKPLHVQYFLWLERISKGDFGVSARTGRPVLGSIIESYPLTLGLAVYALFLALFIAIPLGTMAATSSSRIVGFGAQAWALFGLSVPAFWAGTMFILLFSVYLDWFPLLTRPSFFVSPLKSLWGFFLPALTLAIPNAAAFTQMVRASVFEIKGQDYIKTARAKGLGESVIVFKHMLRNAMIPIITIVGIVTGYLIGGAIVVEQIFAIPGLGRLALQAIIQRDFPTLQGVVLFMATAFVLVNLTTDLLYIFLNPKIRYG